MKKIVSVALVAVLLLVFSTTAYAGGHTRRDNHHNSRPTATWHSTGDGYFSHRAFECEEFCYDRHYSNNRHNGRRYRQRNISGFLQHCLR